MDDEPRDELEQQRDKSRNFAKVLNHLFETRTTDSGRPYTLTEVSRATGMSVPYLSTLRKGTITAVPFERVEMLARFFRVPLDYFSRDAPPEDTLDDVVRRALSKPLVREVALRAGQIGVAQRALVLQMMQHADQVLQDMRDAQEGQQRDSEAGDMEEE